MKGFTLWFTSRPGAGKAPLVKTVSDELKKRHIKTEILENRLAKNHLRDLRSMTQKDWKELLLPLGDHCQSQSNQEIVILVMDDSPYRGPREALREIIADFVEIYVTSTENKARDQNMKKAQDKDKQCDASDVSEFIQTYEEPSNPDVILGAEETSPKENSMKVIQALEIMDLIPKSGETGYSEDEEAIIEERLRSLGYL